jgi:glycosyltransferase involved in cell wall biosynthesis
VHVVPHGTELDPPPDAAAVRARSGPFVALGDDRPRKNRALVRQAHALAARTCEGLPPLRFVGPPDDYVDEATKRSLLRSCCAVVQGSRFEGFGLPVLEALAHGAPLVCADIPPFREIAAGAAEFVDPRDPQAIAAALVRIHTDDALRLAHAAAGHRAATAHSPHTVAQRWRAIHEALCR